MRQPSRWRVRCWPTRSVRCVPGTSSGRQVRHAVVSVVRYLLRMTSRATPFGLFAGVAPAHFGSELAVRYGEDHHAVARVDADWLAGVITCLEGCSELRRRLPVVLNNLSFVRDGRLVVGCQQQPAGSSWTAPAEVSVRHTGAVETVMQAARSPIRVGDLTGTLTADFPGTPESVIERMLAELVAQRILVTSLRPPMTATDPLAYVVGELTAVGAEEVPQAALLFEELREVHVVLSQHNRLSSPAVGRDLRSFVSRRMAAISSAERPLTVDLRVDCAFGPAEGGGARSRNRNGSAHASDVVSLWPSGLAGLPHLIPRTVRNRRSRPRPGDSERRHRARVSRRISRLAPGAACAGSGGAA